MVTAEKGKKLKGESVTHDNYELDEVIIWRKTCGVRGGSGGMSDVVSVQVNGRL